MDIKRPSLYTRLRHASKFISRRTDRRRHQAIEPEIDVDQETLYEEPIEKHKWTCLDEDNGSIDDHYMDDMLESYTNTLDKLLGIPNTQSNTRNTAVLIVLSPCALAAGNIARQRRKIHKPCIQL
ncbi:hypothetical protein RMATCC62417_09970 [Rhizopus microsporus]|nr:hypothetical protein RMATCC62417_09970 [Rhizopus microsporus]CEI88771.1 hypothetical protein RMCBS344292_03149 [Rhizopus microsporus]